MEIIVSNSNSGFGLSPRVSQGTLVFMQQLSKELARINSESALQLLRFGYLTVGERKLTSPEMIDAALVYGEQVMAQEKLDRLAKVSPEMYELVISGSNELLSHWTSDILGDISSTVATLPLVCFTVFGAATNVRQNRHTRSPNDPLPELDYGKLEDRIDIGLEAARLHRKAGH